MATVIKNADRLLRRLNNVANTNLIEGMNKATALVHGQAKDLAPSNDGNLRGSIHMKVSKKGNVVEGRVYTNVEYAPFVEFGTGIKGNGTYPYKIDGLSLTYKGEPWFIPAGEISEATAEKYHFKKVYGKDGAEYYICYGQEAQPYMYPALKSNERAIKTLLENELKTKIETQAKGG